MYIYVDIYICVCYVHVYINHPSCSHLPTHWASFSSRIKKFSHKKDITQYLYYKVIGGDVIDMIQKVPKKEYTLLIADIPYGF